MEHSHKTLQQQKIKNTLLPITNLTSFPVLTADEVTSISRITLDKDYVIIFKLYCCIYHFYTCNIFLFLLESQNQNISNLQVIELYYEGINTNFRYIRSTSRYRTWNHLEQNN